MENTEKTLPDLSRFLASVDPAPDTGLLVVVDNRGCLGMVGGQSLFQGCGVVVGTLNQGLAGNVIFHVLLGRVEDLVVRASRGRVDQSASNTRNEESVVNLQFDGVLELLTARGKHVV